MEASVGTSKDFMNEIKKSDRHLQDVDVEKSRGITSKKKCKIRRMWLAALAALLLSTSIGLCSGYSAPATYDMKYRPNSVLKPTEKETMWIGSIIALGVVAGALFAGYLTDKIGRKDTIVLNIIPGGIGWLIICYSKTVPVIILGRFLTGVACGFTSVAAPVYCVEISTVEVRGILGSSFQGFLVIGTFLSVTIGAFVSWNYLALHGAVFTIVATICFLPMPETPRWLLTKNKVSKAIRVMKSLQGDFVDAEKECEIIYNDIKSLPQGKLTLVDFKDCTVIIPTLIGITIMLLYEFSGANAVFLYSSSIFEAGKDFLDPKISSIILAAVQVVATLFSNLIVDKVGRKILLILSGSFMSLSLAAFGVFFYKSSEDASFVLTFNWIPLLSLTLFVIAFSLGFGPIPHLIIPELLPIRVRGVVCAIVQAFNGLFAFIVTNTFSDLENSLGKHGTFWFYSAECFLAVIIVYFFVPETKGKRLEEIERIFRKKKAKQEVNLSTIT